MGETNYHSGLVALPVELIKHICSYLCPACITIPAKCKRLLKGQADLSRLSKTCRRLKDIAQPILFHSFSDAGRSPPRRQMQLLRLLTSSPHLAQHIRAINIDEPSYHIELTEADQEFLVNTVSSLGIDPPPLYWNKDGSGEWTLLVLELILILTPNLEALVLPLDYDWQLPIVNHLAKSKPFLPNLKSLEVDHYYISGDRYEVNVDAIFGIADAAPNLQFLSIPSPGWCGGVDKLSVGNLRRLEFQANSFVSPDLLSSLCGSAPKLEYLALHWDAMSDTYDYCGDRRTSDAWDAVGKCAGSLKELRLDVREDLPHEKEALEGMRCSLGDFEKLEKVRVDGHALDALRLAWVAGGNEREDGVHGFLAQLFPFGVKEVWFWRLDGREGMTRAMLEWARLVGEGEYPELERVVLAPSDQSDRYRGWGGYDEWRNVDGWYGMKGVLDEEFDKGGVSFEIKSDSPYWLRDEV